MIVFIQFSWSALSKLLAFLNELLEREVAYEQFVGLVKEIPDDVVLALMTKSAEILLFLLFED